MKITYIFHSCFAVETDDCILVFDYWLDPQGVAERLLRSDKPMYVFVSHFHEDHFNREIFGWKTVKTDITYILSKDIVRRRRARVDEADVWLAKGGRWNDSLVGVVAAGSNDSGVSWIVDVAGRRLFHAGDLNNWYARFLAEGCDEGDVFDVETGCSVNPQKEEKRFLGELKDIRKQTDAFDVAMFPVDGRIGNGYTRGARQFISRFRVGLLVPMHFVACGFESAWRMAEFTDVSDVRFWKIERDGDTIEV